jgi:hypothetical protein
MAATIQIDDREYDIENDLNDSQRYMVDQINAAKRKQAQARVDMDQGVILEKGFSEALIASLKSQEDDDGENGNGSTQAD